MFAFFSQCCATGALMGLGTRALKNELDKVPEERQQRTVGVAVGVVVLGAVAAVATIVKQVRT